MVLSWNSVLGTISVLGKYSILCQNSKASLGSHSGLIDTILWRWVWWAWSSMDASDPFQLLTHFFGYQSPPLWVFLPDFGSIGHSLTSRGVFLASKLSNMISRKIWVAHGDGSKILKFNTAHITYVYVGVSLDSHLSFSRKNYVKWTYLLMTWPVEHLWMKLKFWPVEYLLNRLPF